MLTNDERAACAHKIQIIRAAAAEGHLLLTEKARGVLFSIQYGLQHGPGVPTPRSSTRSISCTPA